VRSSGASYNYPHCSRDSDPIGEIQTAGREDRTKADAKLVNERLTNFFESKEEYEERDAKNL